MFRAKPLPVLIPQHSQPQLYFIPTRLWRWNRQSVPKRWRLNYRRQWITQKTASEVYVTRQLTDSVFHLCVSAILKKQVPIVYKISPYARLCTPPSIFLPTRVHDHLLHPTKHIQSCAIKLIFTNNQRCELSNCLSCIIFLTWLCLAWCYIRDLDLVNKFTEF
jgi:hypothetical protein